MYILILVISEFFLLCKFLIKKRGKDADYIFILLEIFIFAFFAASRSSAVGQDTESYIKIYENIAQLKFQDLIEFSVHSNIEIGYCVYNKILSLLGMPSQIITIGNSILLYILLYYVVKTNSKNPLLSLFLFFTLGLYQSSYNIVRSMIAAAISFIGVDFFCKKKKVIFVVCIIIGMLFHFSVIVFFVLVLLDKVKIKKKNSFSVFVLMLAISMLAYKAIPAFAAIIPQRYIQYVYRDQASDVLMLIFHILLVFCIVLVQVCFVSEVGYIKEQKRKDNIFFWMILLEVMFFGISVKISIFARMAYMFMPALIIYIPNLIERIEIRYNKKIIYISFICLMTAQYFVRISINNIASSIPYEFFWK